MLPPRRTSQPKGNKFLAFLHSFEVLFISRQTRQFVYRRKAHMQPIKGARQTELIVMIALFSALITVMTAFIKIPTPLGYIHIGDAFIFAAAMLLGPYAAIPAMIGSGLADFITAYFMYIPVTILIKGLMGLLSGFVLARKKRPLPLKFTFFWKRD